MFRPQEALDLRQRVVGGWGKGGAGWRGVVRGGGIGGSGVGAGATGTRYRLGSLRV